MTVNHPVQLADIDRICHVILGHGIVFLVHYVKEKRSFINENQRLSTEIDRQMLYHVRAGIHSIVER